MQLNKSSLTLGTYIATLNSLLILWWAVSPIASLGSPWSTSEAERPFIGLLPICNLSSVDFLFIFFLPFFHWLLPGFLWHPEKEVCWASICLTPTVTVKNEDQAEREENSQHTGSITWLPVAITTRRQVCTLSFSCGQKVFSYHFVYV